LSRFDPVTGSFRNLHVEDGLPDEQVLRLAVHPNGDLYVATFSGLVSLDPDDFAEDIREPSVLLRGLSVRNEPRFPTESDGNTHLTLAHDDDLMSIELAVLDYQNPERNRYAYRLDGVDPDWRYTEGGARTVSYTTLPAGNYLFRFRGMGSSGRWVEPETPLGVTVLPAPWATAWAYAGYLAVSFVILAGFVRYRTRAARQQAATLQSMVAERTSELEARTRTISEQQKHLQQAIEAKDRLYANVSHEFRTPLTVILGPVDRLLRREGTRDGRVYLEVVRRNAQRLLRLVDQLMTLARVDAHRVATPGPIRVEQIVKAVAESFRTLADDKNIDFSVDVKDTHWIACDRDTLEKIVANLVSNAIKFTPEGGQVAITVCRESDDQLRLIVSDTGIGISPEDQSAVFDRFFRATGHEAIEGSGLGLALVKELVEATGGRIELVSAPGSGTMFSVWFELCEAADPSSLAEEDDSSSVAELEAASLLEDEIDVISDREGGTMPTAVVIEDNRDLCWHIGEVMGDLLHCEFAHDGEAGVEMVVDLVPDIVLCDVALPRLNGFEVTRQLKMDERTSHIPLILLTARSDEESRLRGLQALADEYVTKPFSEAELKQRVETLLAIREILRQQFGREAPSISSGVLPANIGSRDRRFLERVREAVAVHFADPEFSMNELAELVAMSERQLQRKLKAITNVTPREYLRTYRLEQALALLKAGESAGVVAFAVGFSSHSYFSTCFKAQYGVTPGQAAESGVQVDGGLNQPGGRSG
jgi:signal transduction histidine kinase/DNA-binding response OmpR family regulator